MSAPGRSSEEAGRRVLIERAYQPATARIARAADLYGVMRMRMVHDQMLPFFGMAKSRRPLRASMSEGGSETS